MATAAPHTDTVELFVRSLSATGTTASRYVDRVRDLTTTEHVDSASITIWGDEVELSNTACRTDAGRLILDRVATFRGWADDRDVTMDPFFEERAVASAVTGESFTALRLPRSCLAEYDDGELVHVAPYSTGEAVCSVADRLRQLEDPDREGAAEASARLRGLASH